MRKQSKCGTLCVQKKSFRGKENNLCVVKKKNGSGFVYDFMHLRFYHIHKTKMNMTYIHQNWISFFLFYVLRSYKSPFIKIFTLYTKHTAALINYVFINCSRNMWNSFVPKGMGRRVTNYFEIVRGKMCRILEISEVPKEATLNNTKFYWFFALITDPSSNAYQLSMR